MTQPVGIYVSVPFCKAKCTFCNFASDAFPLERMQGYVERLVAEIHGCRAFAERHGMALPHGADSVFFGGGTPSLLSTLQFQQIFEALRSQFRIDAAAEITVEAAPGQISDELLDTFCSEGVNRISLGVQSFVDRESRAVGRLHTAAQCITEIERLAAAGVRNRNVDLIAGLPHQDAASWQQSLAEVVASGVEHVSVYMLEVDDESKLGREVAGVRAASQLEVLGQQARYSADAVPSEELCADLYAQACYALQIAGVQQYEISNFALPGYESRHNCKYWKRDPYIGFGLDAHSMLNSRQVGAVSRFANADDLSAYLESREIVEIDRVDGLEAFEEAVFLGLRLNAGICLTSFRESYPKPLVDKLVVRARELSTDGLMLADKNRLCLTERGRVLSSSVFGELLAVPA